MVAKYAKMFTRLPLVHKLFYVLSVVVLIFVVADYAQPVREGLREKGKKFTLKKGPAIYDEFYVQLYDDLLFSKSKVDFEIAEIIKKAALTKQSRILDLGSGCGHHVGALHANGYAQVQGLDISPYMVRQAKQNYPEARFSEGDLLDTMLYPGDSFTHVTCFYFTLYYIQNKERFFQNCWHWLRPGGILVIHVVDPEQFDPIIPAGDPFRIVSPQSYADKRLTKTVVKFDQFDYQANFEMMPRGVGEGIQDVNATLTETFTRKDNQTIRKNEHGFYMPPESVILALAKQAGFIVRAKIDLVECQYAHQYLYVLEKPT